MTKSNTTIIEGIATSRENLLEIIIIAILLALGVNLIAGSVLALSIEMAIWTLIAGFILCLLSLGYLAHKIIGVENRSYEAFLVYNGNENEICSVPRYRFSQDLHKYLSKALVEDSALKSLWKNEPLKNLVSSEELTVDNSLGSFKIITEAIEYTVLMMLILNLISYFSPPKFPDTTLKTYKRDDLQDLVSKNRFFDLFSSPMKTRAAFIPYTSGELENEEEEIIAAYTPFGIYENFGIILPKEISFEKSEDYKLEIKSKWLNICILIIFEGYATSLPEGFERYYLGTNDVDAYLVKVDIRIIKKFRILPFSTDCRQYHLWLDPFLETLKEYLSRDAFFERINWESQFTEIQYLELAEKRKKASEHFAKGIRWLDQEINVNSLKEYLHNKFPNRDPSDTSSISELVHDLSKAGYETLRDVNFLVEKSKYAFDLYEKEQMRERLFDVVGVVRESAEISDVVYRQNYYRELSKELEKENLTFSPPDLSKYEKLIIE